MQEKDLKAIVGNLKERPTEIIEMDDLASSEAFKVNKSQRIKDDGTLEELSSKHRRTWLKKRAHNQDPDGDELSDSDDSSDDGDLDMDFSPHRTTSFEEDIFDRSSISSDASDYESIMDETEYFDGKGEDLSEVLGTNIALLFLEKEKQAPKVRLLKEGEDIWVMSKFIEGFQNLYQYTLDKNRENGTKEKLYPYPPTGLGSIYAASYLVGDTDFFNGGNVGLVNGATLARVDFGKALSFEDLDEADAIQDKIDKMSPKVFNSKAFKSLDFAGELAATTNKLNIGDVKEIIQLSIVNFKKAYGEDFLNDPEINIPLKRRLGFKASEELTEESLTKKICDNMQERSIKLHNLSQSIMDEIFPQRGEIALAAYQESIHNNKINYIDFMQKLKAKGLDFTDPSHVNIKLAKKRCEDPLFNALIDTETARLADVISKPYVSSTTLKKQTHSIKGGGRF